MTRAFPPERNTLSPVKVVRHFASEDACGNEARVEDLEVTIVNSCHFNVFEAFSGENFEVDIQVTEVPSDGDHPIYLKFEVTNKDNRAGDLRGVFFNISSISENNGFKLSETEIIVTEMHDQDYLTDHSEKHSILPPSDYDRACLDDGENLLRLNNDVLMKGGGKGGSGGRKYSCAVEVSRFCDCFTIHGVFPSVHLSNEHCFLVETSP